MVIIFSSVVIIVMVNRNSPRAELHWLRLPRKGTHVHLWPTHQDTQLTLHYDCTLHRVHRVVVVISCINSA